MDNNLILDLIYNKICNLIEEYNLIEELIYNNYFVDFYEK